MNVNRLDESEEQYTNSNITVYFAEGNHGDSMLFDGIDGELAHSCSLSNTKSPFRGHIHLDDAENWNKGILKFRCPVVIYSCSSFLNMWFII